MSKHAEYLDLLASNPLYAFQKWNQFDKGDQAALVNLFVLRRGLRWTKKFVEGAKAGRGRVSVWGGSKKKLPPKMTPQNLRAAGYIVLQSLRPAVWINASGDEIWIYAQPAKQPKKKEQEHPDVTEIRLDADDLDHFLEDLDDQLEDLKNRVGSSEYPNKYSSLISEYKRFSNELLKASKNANEIRTETQAPSAAIAVQIGRLTSLDSQRQQFIKKVAKLPSP